MGFGLGTKAGMIASIFHILAHAATKSLLFVSAIGLTDVSAGSRKFVALTGSGYRNKVAGVAFTVGSLSMVGMPMFAGFISKLLYAQAAVQNQGKMLPALIVLAVSTILNAIYFMKTVIRIYTPIKEIHYPQVDDVFKSKLYKLRVRDDVTYSLSLLFLIATNFVMGILSQPIVNLIERGLDMFS